MDTKRRRRTVEPEDDWSLCFAMLQNRLRGLLQGASAVKAVMEATHALCAAPKTRNGEINSPKCVCRVLFFFSSLFFRVCVIRAVYDMLSERKCVVRVVASEQDRF